jgi:hypothetical protein
MAFVTDASFGKVRFSARMQPSNRNKPSGLSFPAAATIAGVGAVAVLSLVTSFAGNHGAKLPMQTRFQAIALTSPEERARFQNFKPERDFRPQKTSRLYPVNAGSIVTHVAHQYQVPPREAVASVNVPLHLGDGSQIASATRSLTANQPVDATQTGSLPPQREIASAADTPDNRFGLVMQNPDFQAPLPMARPDNWPKAPASRSGNNSNQRALAYANPNTDNSVLGLPPKATVAPKMQPGVAIYDISAHTVYMPDGTKFEAHSGLRQFRDKPKYTKLKAKGPTPPNTYKLSMRESLFHGVPALRMTPMYPSRMHGRGGILTHTYLRRRPGDSAGCVAFKHYYKFLKYYKRGEVKTMIVVPRLADAPSQHKTLASLFKG